jgi:hypothetical protein
MLNLVLIPDRLAEEGGESRAATNLIPTVIYFRHSDTMPELSSGVQDNKPVPKASAQCQRDIPLPNVLYSDDNPSQNLHANIIPAKFEASICRNSSHPLEGHGTRFFEAATFLRNVPNLSVASQNTHSWITQLLRKQSVLHHLPAGRLAATHRQEPAKFVSFC